MNTRSCHYTKIRGKTVFNEEIHTGNNKYQENIDLMSKLVETMFILISLR